MLATACNSEDEFINPFVNDEGFASRAAFVRFEETPEVLNDAEVPFDQIGNFSVSAQLVDPAGNVASYELRVALNPGNALPKDVQNYQPLLTLDNFREDVPVDISISIADVTAALGISLDDLEVGNIIDFEAIVTREDGVSFDFNNLTGDMFNRGFRQAISFEIELTDSRPQATYFLLLPDEEGEVELGGATFRRAELDEQPVAEGNTLDVYAEFNNELQTLPTFSVVTADGGSFGAAESVSFTEDDETVNAVRATFTAGSLSEGSVAFTVSGAVETGDEGGETMVEVTEALEVDNVAPVYTLSYSAPGTNVGFTVTISAEFSEEIVGTPTISIDGQGISTVEAAEMTLETPTLATYRFSPAGGVLTEGPLNLSINASDLAGNMANADPDNPRLEIVE